MPYKTGSIREIHRSLVANGYHISENTLRTWVKQGVVVAAFVGKKAYVNYDNVVSVLTNGTANAGRGASSPHAAVRMIG